MKLKDFKITKVMIKEVAKKRFQGACESCFMINPIMEDGYTICCNECRVDGKTAIRLAKREDIHNFLNTKFKNVSSNGSNSEAYCNFELPTKSKKIKILLDQTESGICEQLLTNIKGLRKDN
jgi:hypothetical protein